jgi:hypothetical protein
VTRIGLAFRAFFRVLGDADFAERVATVLAGPSGAAAAGIPPVSPAKPPVKEAAKKTGRNEALGLLAMLQREARLVDFLQEPIAAYSDEQIGAAVRDVHRDGAAVLERVFGLKPIVAAEEGSQVDVPDNYDAARFRLTGAAADRPPFRGLLAHHGWEATRTALPEWTGNAEAAKVIAPAVVELS